MGLAGIVAGDAANDLTAEDQRNASDRRTMTYRTVVFGFLRSRRREPRRLDEKRGVYRDWHHPWLFFLGVSIMLMSVADAFLTLKLLAVGAVEANPVMRGLIDWNTAGFVSLKLLMTGLAILTLVYASRYRLFGRLRVGLIITLFFCIYTTLIFYEIMGLIELGAI